MHAALITVALGLASCSLAGLYCNHGDLSPRYAAILLGLTNTTAALPGILGVAFTGALLDATGEVDCPPDIVSTSRLVCLLVLMLCRTARFAALQARGLGVRCKADNP